MTDYIQRLEEELKFYNTKEKIKKNGEVFTPNHLIQKMNSIVEESFWKDPNKKVLDPCAGLGNFSIFLLEKFMIGLSEWEPDEEKRRKHILENVIFHVEMNEQSIMKLNKVLNPEGKYKLNILCQDFLTINKPKKTPLF